MTRPARLAAGGALLGASTLAALARRHEAYGWELAVFRPVNELPDQLHPPVWAVMQLGALGAGPALGLVAWKAGQPQLAKRLVAGATIDWVLSKVVKRIVRRERPLTLVPHTRIRGKQATGLGYLSGHSAIATSLMVGVAAITARRGPWAALAGAVGLGRMYVGAHMPLDVLGGFGQGLVVDDAVRRYLQG